MRRRLIQLGLFLLLGAIVNVAVAWGCALWVHANPYVGSSLMGVTPGDDPRLIFHGWVRFGTTRILSWPRHDWGTFNDVFPLEMAKHFNQKAPYWSRASIVSEESIFESSDVQIEDARGWPFRSMRSLFSRSTQLDLPGTTTELIDGIPLPPGPSGVLTGDDERALPVRPIWPGFAINTLFYATVLWLLFAAPFALRRWWRVKRGLCPACAYPVGASDVCTECGRSVPLSLALRRIDRIATSDARERG